MGKTIKHRPHGSNVTRQARRDALSMLRQGRESGATRSQMEALGDTLISRAVGQVGGPADIRVEASETVAEAWEEIAAEREREGNRGAAGAAQRMAIAEAFMPGYTAIVRALLPTWESAGDPMEAAELSLATWLWIRGKTAAAAARATGPSIDDARRSTTDLARLVPAARVIAFPSDLPLVINHEVDLALHRAAGLEWKSDPCDGSTAPPDTMRKWEGTLRAAMGPDGDRRTVPPAPFPITALVFGVGSALTPGDVLARTGTETDRVSGFMLAMLIEEATGDVWDVSAILEPEGMVGLHCWRMRRGGEWQRQAVSALYPLVLDRLLDSSLRFRGAPPPARTFAERRRLEQATAAARVAGPPPAPFYVVRASDLARGDGAGGTHASPSFRFDVRGHDRLLVHRGEGEVDAVALARMERRGYRFAVGRWPRLEGDDEAPLDLGGALARAARARGHAEPTPGEWVAVRVVRVRAHVKGPEDGVYVPGLRVESTQEVDRE